MLVFKNYVKVISIFMFSHSATKVLVLRSQSNFYMEKPNICRYYSTRVMETSSILPTSVIYTELLSFPQQKDYLFLATIFQNQYEMQTLITFFEISFAVLKNMRLYFNSRYLNNNNCKFCAPTNKTDSVPENNKFEFVSRAT